MRLLVFADPHLHNWSSFGIDPVTGLSKRLVDQQKVTKQIISLAVTMKVDAVLCLGDIIHSVGTVSTEVLNTAYLFFQAFRQAGIPVYFVPGNHDLNNRKNPKWYNYSCKVFEPTPPPASIKIIGYHETIDYEAVKGFDIVAIHKTPLGARLGSYTFEQGFDWKTIAANNKLVLCGHIHQRQHLTDNCIIVGSPMHLTFGDEGERGIYLVDTDKGTAEFKKLKYPEFITVENYSDTKDDGNYYRVLQKPQASDSIVTENVKVNASPTYLPERIKSTSFYEILKEWLVIQEKPESYLDALSDIIDDKFQLGKTLYNGKLQQVTIKDFLSIGEITYTVENGFTLVLGANDIFNSNGSGKSSLFEAIYWCLFGKTTKGLTADDVIRNRPTQQADCKVTLWLKSDNGAELHITRSRAEGIGIFKKTEDGLFYDICGERKLADCQKLLEEILGFDEKLFRTSCYFSQENLLMLTGLEDADRTKMITDLLGFESYNDLYAQTHKKIEKLSREISTHEEDIAGRELKIANAKGKLSTYEEHLASARKAAQEIQVKLAAAKDNKSLVEEELESFQAVELPFRDFDAEEAELEKYQVSTKADLASVAELMESTQQALAEATAQYQTACHEASTAISSFIDLEKELMTINKASEGAYCLSCGSLVSKETKQEYIASKTAELLARKAKRITCEKEVSRTDSVVVSIKETRASDLATKKRAEKLLETVEIQLSSLRKERRSYDAKKQEQSSQKANIQAKLQTFLDKINECTKQLEASAAQTKAIQESIATLAKFLEDHEAGIAEFKEKIQAILEQIDILEIWKTAFSPKGIRALLLDKFCNDFNQIVNVYLHQISNENMGLLVQPTSMTKGGEERNKIGLVVYFKDYQVKYASLSGGEKRRVDCSLIFGLSKYLETKYNLGAQGLLGVLVLDEVFGGLDKSGEDTLINLLAEESKSKAIFIIDHLLNLTGSADRVWTVGKIEDVSFITLE